MYCDGVRTPLRDPAQYRANWVGIRSGLGDCTRRGNQTGLGSTLPNVLGIDMWDGCVNAVKEFAAAHADASLWVVVDR